MTLNPGTPDEEALGPLETRVLKAGDVIRFERSGGAGYGPVAQRDPDAVRADVANGYVSEEAARRQYGVETSIAGKDHR